MSEPEEFTAHLVNEDSGELQAGINVTAFRPSSNKVVEEVRKLLVDEFEVIER